MLNGLFGDKPCLLSTFFSSNNLKGFNIMFPSLQLLPFGAVFFVFNNCFNVFGVLFGECE